MDNRKGFHQQLNDLIGELVEMGKSVGVSIRKAVDALTHMDPVLAEWVIEHDDVFDQLQIDIETRCLKLLALQQPMASDLRAIGTALKVVTDLERIADHAVDIAKTTLQIQGQELIKPLIDIPRLAVLCEQMLDSSLKAYIHQDIALAEALASQDDEADQIFSQIFRELLVLMMENPATIRQATQLLIVAQNLERIADHTTNIGEWTIYAALGERRDLNR
jgi:phosphate transport system protein